MPLGDNKSFVIKAVDKGPCFEPPSLLHYLDCTMLWLCGREEKEESGFKTYCS